ncbi:MAG: hypothetical protein KDD61_10400 [Bdellovibrionales bacterium]|nr:hypothetical protein [Bdellovibrionales bacterium]
MKTFFYLLSNVGSFLFVTLVLAASQTSLWMQLFGFFPPPNSWVPTLMFFVIYRNAKEGIALTLFTSLAVSTMTVSPTFLFLVTSLSVYLIARYAKHRIFWTGPTYFMGLCAFSSAIFPILYLVFSLIWEKSPVHDFAFFESIVRSLLTALLALPVYYLFLFIDTKTNKKLPTDSGNLLYE